MAKIYKDTPVDFISIANRIDAAKIDERKLPEQIKELEKKFITPNVPRRTAAGAMVEVSNIPQIVADVINRYDWNKVGAIKRKIAKVAVENKLTQMSLLKN